MRYWCLAMMLLMTACSHTQVSVNSGTQGVTTAINLQTNSPALAAVLIMGMFISAAVDETLSPQRAAQPMDPQRKVVEQDCTRPVDTSIPLKCR